MTSPAPRLTAARGRREPALTGRADPGRRWRARRAARTAGCRRRPLLGRATRPRRPGVVGIIRAAIALLGAILVLATHEFGFSVDVDHLYESAYADREDPETYLLRIAESHPQARLENRDGVRALQRYLVGGLLSALSRVLSLVRALDQERAHRPRAATVAAHLDRIVDNARSYPSTASACNGPSSRSERREVARSSTSPCVSG